MLSPEGRCKTLDASADGYLRAEAVGVLALVPMPASPSLASSRRPSPLALLAGAAVNQDGRSSALTAPNGPAQQQVMRAALLSAGTNGGGLSPYDVTALSMHGTGTPLGDPIEVGAAAAALLDPNGDEPSSVSSIRAPSQCLAQLPLSFMSSKSWTGHAEPASGIVGLLQSCLAACHQGGLPLLNLRTLNPHVAGALSESAAGTGARRAWAMSRQAHGRPSAAAEPQSDEDSSFVAGVSAFAYQVKLWESSIDTLGMPVTCINPPCPPFNIPLPLDLSLP